MTEQTTGPALPNVGDVVWGRPWHDGQRLARRKGLVLQRRAGDVVVWWYGLGAPESGPTVQAMYARELTSGGHFTHASVRQLGQWERAIAHKYAHSGIAEIVGLGHAINRLRTRLSALATRA